MEQSSLLDKDSKLEQYFSSFKIRHMIIWIIIPLVIAIPMSILNDKNIIDKSTQVIIIEYISMFIPLLWVGIGLKKFSLNWKEFIGKPREKVSKKDFTLVILSEMLFSITTLIILGYIIQHIDITSINTTGGGSGEVDMFKMGVHTYIIGCILAPIAEEIIFRGLLINRLKIKFGINNALIISSIVFAIIHFDMGLAGRAVFGLIVGVLYLKTKSLLPSILFHIVANSLIILPMALSELVQEESIPVDNDFITNEMLIGAIIIAILSISYIGYFLYKNWPRQNKI